MKPRKFHLFLLAMLLPWAVNAADLGRLRFEGASITAGLGASLPLELRIKAHLKTQPELNSAPSPRVLVAFDYFFVTNFAAMNPQEASDASFRQAVNVRIAQWLGQYDHVVIGLMPTTRDLEPGLREFLNGDGKAFRGAYDYLDKCCGARAAAFNALLTRLAAREPRLHLVKLSDLLGVYQSRPGLKPRAKELYNFPDNIHLNDQGQAVLFNLGLKPVLERIWNLSLGDMPAEKPAKEQVDAVWKTFSRSPEDFLKRKPGLYKATLLMEGLRKGSFASGSKSDNEDIHRLRVIDTVVGIKARLGDSEAVPLYVRDDGTIVLDLVKAMFFHPMPLRETSRPGQYRDFGYDYWEMSLAPAAVLNLAAWIQSGPGKLVATNYDFVLSQKDPAKSEMELSWTLYNPVSDGDYHQAPVKLRGVLSDEKARNLLLNSGGEYSRLNYRTKILVGAE